MASKSTDTPAKPESEKIRGSSTRNTGNEPADGIDPGGTRPAPGRKRVTQKVESGDRNEQTGT